MSHPLDSCASKIQRSEANYATLNQDARAWVQEAISKGQTVTVRKEVDSQTGDIHFVADTVPDTPRNRWGAILGDCVHNLRCSLDHLMFALADLHAPNRDRDGDNVTQFPITKSRPHWDSDSVQRRFTYVSDRHRRMVKEIQPWFTQPNDVAVHPLSVLERLDNRDKHRLLSVVALANDLWSYYPDVSPFQLTNATITTQTLWENPLEKDARLMTVRITRIDPDGPDPDVNMQPIEAAPNLVIGQGELVKYIVPNLNHAVRGIVARFAPEFS